MRSTILYVIIFLLILSNSLLGQGNSTWNNTKEIFERLNYHRDQFNLDSSIYYNDQLIKYAIDRKEEGAIITASFQKINTLRLFNKQNEAFQLALSTYDKYCDENRDDKNCNSCKYIYGKLVEFMIMMQDYRQALFYVNMTCNQESNALYYYDKAQQYCFLELPDSALMATSKYISIVIVNKTSKVKTLVGAYNNHGLIARKLDSLDVAITAFSTAIDIIDSVGEDIFSYGFIMGNLGACYYDRKEYDKAYDCLLIDSKGSLNGNQTMSYLNAELLITEIDVIRKDYKKATHRIKTILETYDKELLVDQKVIYYELLMQVYKATNNDSQYKIYSDKWIKLNREEFQNKIKIHQAMADEYAANSLRHVTKQIESEKQLMAQQMLVQQKEEEKNQLRNWLLIGGLSAAIVFILFFFWKFRTDQKRKLLLKEARLKMAKQEQDLLELKVKEESKNVQTLSLELLMKKDFTSGLVKELNQLENISKTELKNIEIYIQNELDVKSTRAHLQHQMGELSSEFYNSLLIKHPTLKDSDLKLAAMVAMDMSNKEVGISKNISADSVKKTKYRLKKKLNLKAESSLFKYLKGYI